MKHPILAYINKYSLWMALAWTLIIFVLCCTPGRYIPTTHWLELLSFDKFVHASIFFVLTLSWLLALNGFGKFSIVVQMLTVATCVLYGGLLEIMQATLFSQRSGDWLDFIANSVGCFTAFWSFKRSAIA